MKNMKLVAVLSIFAVLPFARPISAQTIASSRPIVVRDFPLEDSWTWTDFGGAVVAGAAGGAAAEAVAGAAACSPAGAAAGAATGAVAGAAGGAVAYAATAAWDAAFGDLPNLSGLPRIALD